MRFGTPSPIRQATRIRVAPRPPVVHTGPRIAGDEAVPEEVPPGACPGRDRSTKGGCGGLRLDVGSKGAHRRQGRQEKRNRGNRLPYLSLQRCLPGRVCRTNASKKRIRVVPCDRILRVSRTVTYCILYALSESCGNCILRANSIASDFSRARTAGGRDSSLHFRWLKSNGENLRRFVNRTEGKTNTDPIGGVLPPAVCYAFR